MKNLLIDDFTIYKSKNVIAYLKNHDFLQKLDKKCNILSEGRGYVLEVNGYVIRFYSHGGIFRKFVQDKFFSAKRFINELKIHNYLFKKNFPVPEPIGIIFFKNFIFYHGVFITKKIYNSIDLIKFILKNREKDFGDIFFKIGKIVRKLHSLNVYHGDLHLKNFIISNDKIYLLDFDKSKITSNNSRKIKEILRFLRSMEKFNYFHGNILKKEYIFSFFQGAKLNEKEIKKILSLTKISFLKKISWNLNKPIYLKKI